MKNERMSCLPINPEQPKYKGAGEEDQNPKKRSCDSMRRIRTEIYIQYHTMGIIGKYKRDKTTGLPTKRETVKMTQN